MEIEGRNFLVAGGDSGLGGAATNMLQKAGANVVETEVTDEFSIKAALKTALRDGPGWSFATHSSRPQRPKA